MLEKLPKGATLKNAHGLNLAFHILRHVGYVPVLGTISGVFRVYDAVFSRNHDRHVYPKELRKGLIVRGAFEIAGIGFFLAIPDMIMTMNRRYLKEPNS